MSGVSKVICIRKCSMCGKDIEIRHKDRVDRINVFCSKKCEGEFRKSLKDPNTICPICGESFYSEEFHKKRFKVVCCSMDCCKKYRASIMSGNGNHQYGLLGELNASWKSDEKITYYGYRKIRCLDHPLKDCDGFVFEHRLIAEKFLLTEETTIYVNDMPYLNPYFVVHHIDENKLNNDVNNLLILDTKEHMSLHKRSTTNPTK